MSPDLRHFLIGQALDQDMLSAVFVNASSELGVGHEQVREGVLSLIAEGLAELENLDVEEFRSMRIDLDDLHMSFLIPTRTLMGL